MLERTRWPPDPIPAYDLRERLLAEYRRNPSSLTDARAYYACHSGEFVNTWCDTYDPRNAAIAGRTVRMPFLLFGRQWDIFAFLDGLVAAQCNGLMEKSRDMGATWCGCGWSASKFLFVPGSSIGWGSRKAMLVDHGGGDMDSIFEKLRYLINSVPSCFYPRGFDPDRDMSYMKITCEATESSITGESGDDIGRGGRKMAYLKDESAHYERPEAIEAALADNTNCQVDISSVKGLGTVFHRKREAGTEWEPGDPFYRNRTNVLVLDWRDHPAKDDQWYRAREEAAREAGLLHVFRQEVDRSYSASVLGTIIPIEQLRSCYDAHLRIEGLEDCGPDAGALDVADDTEDSMGDRNAWSHRKGVVLKYAEEWGDRDTSQTAQRAAKLARDVGRSIKVMYDCIGIGAGVKGETNRLAEEKILPRRVKFVAWNAAGKVLMPKQRVVIREDGTEDPESPTNEEFYGNIKAQGWWMLRRRVEKTHRAVTTGRRYHPEELFSIDTRSVGPLMLRQIEKELCQVTAAKSTGQLKLIVNKAPKGTRSPNVGDSIMMNYWPVDDRWGYDETMSGVG